MIRPEDRDMKSGIMDRRRAGYDYWVYLGKKKKLNDRVDHSGARHYKQILQKLQGLL